MPGLFNLMISGSWGESIVEKVVLASTGHRGTDRDAHTLVQLNRTSGREGANA
jgi:hypothetical protein